MSSSELNGSVLQEMLDTDYRKISHRYAKGYANPDTLSPSDVSQQWHDDLFLRLSAPLKKMQAAYLRDISKNCYQDRHMSESFTNYEQINLCKEEKRTKYFGKFEDRLANLRDSNRFKYQDCSIAAGNDIVKSVYCVRDFIQGIQDDNDSLVHFVKENYPKYA